MDGKQGLDKLETQTSKKRCALKENNAEIIDNGIALKFSEKKDEVEVILPPRHEKVLDSVGIDDPAVFLRYDQNNLARIVAAINALQPPPNGWLGITRFPINAEDLLGAIASKVGTLASVGVVDDILFAPCTLQQYSNVCTALSFLGQDPEFIRIGIAPLARVYCIADRRRNTTGVRDSPLAPPGGINLFQ